MPPAAQVVTQAVTARVVRVLRRLVDLVHVAGHGGGAERAQRRPLRCPTTRPEGGPVGDVVRARFPVQPQQRVLRPAEHALRVRPVVGVLRVVVAVVEEAAAVDREVLVGDVVGPAEAVDAGHLTRRVPAAVVRPERVPPVLDLGGVGVVDRDPDLLHLVPLVDQDVEPGRDVGGVVDGQGDLLRRRVDRGAFADPHAGGHLGRAVAAVDVAEVHAVDADPLAVEAALVEVAAFAVHGVHARLPHVRLLRHHPEQHLGGHLSAAGERVQGEQALRGVGGQGRAVPAGRPRDGELPLDREVGRPLAHFRSGLQRLDPGVVARYRARPVRVGRGGGRIDGGRAVPGRGRGAEGGGARPPGRRHERVRLHRKLRPRTGFQHLGADGDRCRVTGLAGRAVDVRRGQHGQRTRGRQARHRPARRRPASRPGAA